MDDHPTVTAQEPLEVTTLPLRRWDEPLLGAVTVGSALKMCGLAFGLWMIGIWISDVRTIVKGINTVGDAVAVLGFGLFVVSCYVLVRVCQLRHPRH